jgi:uncharacterized Zn finger protein
MLQSEMTKQQLQYCADEIKRELSPDIDYDRDKMKKGLNLYRQGSVYNANINGRYIEARVQDVTPFDVMLDLDVLVLSTCPCPADGICRHKLAVFFYAYAMVDRVGVFFQEWKDKKKPVTIRKTHPVNNIETTTIGDTVKDWYSHFKKQHQLYKQNQQKNRYSFNQLFSFESLYKNFYKNLESFAPATPFTKELYLIHASAFTLQMLIEESESSRLSLSSKDSYVYPYVSNMLTLINNRINDIKSTAIPLSSDPLLVDTKEEIRNLLFCGEEYQHERLTAYFIIWKSLLHKNSWIEEEQSILQKKQQSYIKVKSSFAVDCQFALAHLSWLQKNDEEAISLLQRIQGNILNYCFYWTGALQLSKEWERQEEWLQFSLPQLKQYNESLMDSYGKRNLTKQFIQLFENYANKADKEDDLFIQALKELLPFSYYEFSTYLVEKEDYRTWTELQMAVGFDIGELEKEILKAIEKKERGLLLPLYHKAVNDAIKQKSRPAYKLAVRYLKKLRTHYRGLKQMNRWSEYINRLSAEHKRLRAFQEELERGKLLHD